MVAWYQVWLRYTFEMFSMLRFITSAFFFKFAFPKVLLTF